MRLIEIISANLNAWMLANPNLDTIKKVSSRANVGFGTVRRIRNADGNPTISNLQDIAHAFGHRIEDIIAAPGQGKKAISLQLNEPAPPPYPGIEHDLMKVFESMNEKGRQQLLGMAKALAREYPKHKRRTPQ